MRFSLRDRHLVFKMIFGSGNQLILKFKEENYCLLINQIKILIRYFLMTMLECKLTFSLIVNSEADCNIDVKDVV